MLECYRGGSATETYNTDNNVWVAAGSLTATLAAGDWIVFWSCKIRGTFDASFCRTQLRVVESSTALTPTAEVGSWPSGSFNATPTNSPLLSGFFKYTSSGGSKTLSLQFKPTTFAGVYCKDAYLVALQWDDSFQYNADADHIRVTASGTTLTSSSNITLPAGTDTWYVLGHGLADAGSTTLHHRHRIYETTGAAERTATDLGWLPYSTSERYPRMLGKIYQTTGSSREINYGFNGNTTGTTGMTASKILAMPASAFHAAWGASLVNNESGSATTYSNVDTAEDFEGNQKVTYTASGNPILMLGAWSMSGNTTGVSGYTALFDNGSQLSPDHVLEPGNNTTVGFDAGYQYVSTPAAGSRIARFMRKSELNTLNTRVRSDSAIFVFDLGGESSVSVSPGAASTSITGRQPAPTAGASTSPGVASFLVQGYAPTAEATVIGDHTAEPGADTIAVQGFAPTVTASADWVRSGASIHIDFANERMFSGGSAHNLEGHVINRTPLVGWEVAQGSALMTWMNRTSGTVVIRTTGANLSGAAALISTNISHSRLVAADDNTVGAKLSNGGDMYEDLGGGTYLGETLTGHTFGASGSRVCGNGGTIESSDSGIIAGTVDEAYIGVSYFGDLEFNGTFLEAIFWDDADRIGASELQALTAGTTSSESVTAGLGSLTLTGRLPDAQAETSGIVTPANGEIVLTGYAPSLSVSVEAGLGTIVLAGQTPDPSADATVAADRQSLTILGRLVTTSEIQVINETAALLFPQVISLTGRLVTETVQNPVNETSAIVFAFPLEIIRRQPDARAGASATPAVGSTAITGRQPTVGYGAGVVPAAGGLTFVGLAPSVSVSVTSGVSGLSVTGRQPTPSAGMTASPAAGSPAITGRQPAVGFGITVNPARRSLSILELPPIAFATRNPSVTPATGSLVLTGRQPTHIAGTGATVTTALGSLSLTGRQPTPSAGETASPLAGGLTVAGHAVVAEIGIPASASPLKGSLTVQGFAPSLSVSVSPATGSVVLTGRQPVVGFGITQAISAGSLEFDGHAPTHDLDTSVAALAGGLVIAGYQPGVVAGISRQADPATGDLDLTGLAPQPSVAARGQPQAGSIVETGLQPSPASSASTSPQTGSTAITGREPAVTAGQRADQQTGAIVIQGWAPTVVADVAVTAETSSVVIVGRIPDTSINHPVEVANDNLAIQGFAPEIQVSYVAAAGGGEIEIAAYAPVLSANTQGMAGCAVLSIGTGAIDTGVFRPDEMEVWDANAATAKRMRTSVVVAAQKKNLRVR